MTKMILPTILATEDIGISMATAQSERNASQGVATPAIKANKILHNFSLVLYFKFFYGFNLAKGNLFLKLSG